MSFLQLREDVAIGPQCLPQELKGILVKGREQGLERRAVAEPFLLQCSQGRCGHLDTEICQPSGSGRQGRSAQVLPVDSRIFYITILPFSFTLCYLAAYLSLEIFFKFDQSHFSFPKLHVCGPAEGICSRPL